MFIHLLDNDKNPICFIRDKITNYIAHGENHSHLETDKNTKIKWTQFQVDQGQKTGLIGLGNSIKPEDSGFLSYKLYAKILKDEKDEQFDY